MVRWSLLNVGFDLYMSSTVAPELAVPLKVKECEVWFTTQSGCLVLIAKDAIGTLPNDAVVVCIVARCGIDDCAQDGVLQRYGHGR